jgi:hypothetical protein
LYTQHFSAIYAPEIFDPVVDLDDNDDGGVVERSKQVVVPDCLKHEGPRITKIIVAFDTLHHPKAPATQGQWMYCRKGKHFHIQFSKPKEA